MSNWYVRHQGSPTALPVSGPAEVVEGLRDDRWLPTDEVRGPNDKGWVALESHPLFEEVAFDLEPEIEKPDDTHLDMNPLIDVCLVLLIFFILTITYDTLRRSIEVPPEQADEKGAATVQKEELNQMIKVVAYMDGDKPVILLEGTSVPPENVAKEMKAMIEKTGRKVMYMDVNGDVPWGLLTTIIDAAKGSGVHEILRRNNTKR
jgi:biopolymer transport protein ExbD